MLEPQLTFVLNVLPLAAAALTKIGAWRRDAQKRRIDDLSDHPAQEVVSPGGYGNVGRLACNARPAEDGDSRLRVSADGVTAVSIDAKTTKR